MTGLKALSDAVALVAVGVFAATVPTGAQNHIFGNPEILHWAPTRTYHVENYKLTIRFNEPKGEIFGVETITLSPLKTKFRTFYLDSAGLTVRSVSIVNGDGSQEKMTYTIEGSHLWITLKRTYRPGQALQVRVAYEGFPRTGLFFVNPTKEYPNWPREVYSQGEPELNHYWFPCWDYPNDMARSETITTVPEGQVVVSNGKLMRVTRSHGEVTYDWLESIPHSSYLISIAVGPWRKISDHYEDKPVDYYVPKTADAAADEADARSSFGLTPDMIGFFSRATGVDYPYEQYAQTTVKNFIFGGQENVSATTLKETALQDPRANRDFPSTDLVSHELGQHWFGDFVQGRDWANIWLNEGFATYMEALYTQYHEGNDSYRLAIYQDQLTSQEEERDSYERPIVDRHYGDPLQMFDATTHEKGAVVLEMLRNLIDGPEATRHPASQNEPLFIALHHYLTQHREQPADTADLIDAIRKSTGDELDWFFHEWVFMAGHPDYRVVASYDAEKKIEKIIVTQTQAINTDTPIFDMPIELAFNGANGEHKEVQIHNSLQQQTFDIPIDFVPQWVDFDPNDFIDKTLEFEQPISALIAEAEKDPAMMARLWAVQQLARGNPADAEARVAALRNVLQSDSFYGLRVAAATSLGKIGTPNAKAALLDALKEKENRVRAAAVEALGRFSNEQSVFDSLGNALHSDPSYAVQAAAARQIGKSSAAQAFDVLQVEVRSQPETHVMQAALTGLADTKDARAVAIILQQAKPGIPETVRLSALTGLEEIRAEVTANWLPDITDVVAAALHDPFYPIHRTGEELIGVYGLSQFESALREEAASAPLAIQRESAKKALRHLDQQK